MTSLLASSLFKPASEQIQLLLLTSLLCATGAAMAQTADKKPTSPWKVSAGVALVSTPEYEGSKKTVTGLLPDLNVSYKTDGYGSLALGSKARGLSWTAIDTNDYSLGLSLGASTGRVDNKDGSAFAPGSKRLIGMGKIKPALEYGVFGHVTAGVPLTFAVIKNAGNGKINVKDSSFNGDGGTRVEVGAEIPWEINSQLGLSFSPNLVWADKKYTQANFGVSTAQSVSSGFKAYNANGGIKSVGLTVGANYKIDSNWSANAALSINQLRGDAAKSPLVQKKAQNTFVVGVSYAF